MATASEPLNVVESKGGRKAELADGIHGICLDAMRAASPPRENGSDYGSELYGDQAMEAQYSAWKRKHPSALENFDALARLADGKRVAVFLDYDGTLSPIVDDPDRAFMSEDMRAAVKEVAAHFPTAIISGRGREKVFDFVQLSELYYAGSHGMDIMGPAHGTNGKSQKENGTSCTTEQGNDVVLFQPASEFMPTMNEVHAKLKEGVKDIEGAWVEHNKFCVSVHFRRVREERWDKLAAIVNRVLTDYPKLRVTHGRKVLEVRPVVDWDKGKALSYLLKSLELEDNREVMPLYIGDDRTDEDAFSVLRERNLGHGILVSTVAKSTVATYTLRDPSEVQDFLHRLVKWREKVLGE